MCIDDGRVVSNFVAQVCSSFLVLGISSFFPSVISISIYLFCFEEYNYLDVLHASACFQ